MGSSSDAGSKKQNIILYYVLERDRYFEKKKETFNIHKRLSTISIK